MRYYKIIDNGYIYSIGTGNNGIAITEEEYNQIMEIIHTKPTHINTMDYRLKEDLTWEEYEIEFITDESVPEAEELLDILLSGEET